MQQPINFVPHEPSLALKELGFDEPCFGYYDASNLEKYEFIIQNNVKNSDFIFGMTAPLYQQAFRWFREKYKLASHIAAYWQHDWNNYSYQYHFVEDKTEWNGIEHYKTYEEAELACLKNLIEIVKQQTHATTN
jgi:hypothetical protein